MNTRVIHYTGGCRNCRGLNNFSTLIVSEEEMNSLSRDELVDTIDENQESCPDCGRRGTIKIFIFKIGNLIYDMQTSPQSGRITLRAEKENSNLETCELGADNSSLSFYDYYNALAIFDNELETLRTKNQSSEQGELQTLQTLPKGGLIFSAKLNLESPYIIPFGVSMYGFSYEEVYKILSDLKQQIRTRLKEGNMPY